jgi:polysaccharide export outer membrane protein
MSRRVVLLLVSSALAACASAPAPAPTTGPSSASLFKAPLKTTAAPLMSKEDLALLEESVNPIYQIGSGDIVRVDVFGRPEVSGKHVVGPDGRITVPIVGELALADRSREEARSLVEKGLRPYYSHPHVTLAVEEYVSNQVTVLGRVERAGMLKFAHPPTLAEVLASAGAMPILDKQATLTRCAIMRGRERLIWVDLKSLLNGDPAYNLRMRKGDIVFIPDSADTAVYVLGQVHKPGSYRLTPRMTLLDAIAQAGGPNEDSQPQQIGLYRAGASQVEMFSFADVINPARAINYSLEDGDVVFVPRSNLADIGYFLRQISPAMSVLNFGLALKAVTQ